MAQQHFQTGRRAYEAQNFQAAFEAFDAAIAAGMAGPAIHFNVGVLAYRLGRYERAVTEFNKVAGTPSMAALAHYNLGLVELKRGRTAAARGWFARAQEEAADERLRELAAAQLGQLPSPTVGRNWIAYGAAGLGYDDNVALVSDNDVLGVSDTADEFTEITLAVSGPLERAWRLDAGVFATLYQSLNEFDQLVAQGGAHYRFDYATWTNEALLELSHTQLDATGFENRLLVGLQGIVDISQQWRLRLRYRYTDVDGLNEFNGLDGTRHDAQARAQREWGSWQLGLQYDFESNSYSDETLSMRQHKVSVVGERGLARGWWTAVEAAQRFSDYKLSTHGNEDRFEAGIALKKQLSPSWRLSARYDYAKNAAKLADFDYRRNRVWVGAEATL
ncbi:MAG: tetratricopeptide repeat protein [Steroidobacteraceae bacterium]